MPVNRRRVEEEKARMLAPLTPIKTRILETLATDPEHLYSATELAELFWTVPSPPPQPLPEETREAYRARIMALPPPEPKNAEHPLITQEGAKHFDDAISMLVEEKTIVAYPYEGEYYFGIVKEKSPEGIRLTCRCGDSCNCS